ncbi:CBL-interacting protein kinase 3 isoform X1 [Oryza brachyantha]|uniref:CBL-interacting protein kinase 3 isoform X1 n=1 Tax=Oryza brachyantha TaxID=4533 RepID=UPI00077668C3|nr:CBL-interacting protein kinase 3 isoform X1 [Oryza brachyantha]XP_015695095.1 CBL-interacting protein kinase 3 isoform X1 [Oryza brachyantha]XP_015695096.1 CBL-interacting protein kinase 3 isoform X1 [Oryza brachyantha]
MYKAKRSAAQKVRRRVGKYELGRTIGQGTFAKVRFAKNMETGDPVAIKILDKEKVQKHRLIEQIRREICTMKLIQHPNVVHLHEVMGSKTKIFIVLKYAMGGELHDIIVSTIIPLIPCMPFFLCSNCVIYTNIFSHHNLVQSSNFISYNQATGGRLKEDEARRYFQQLINAVDYCHSRGVYHRDLKLENLLLDTAGNLKVSDFGLSAISEQVKADGLLHTTCGTPNYVAPEVIEDKGYDGALADLWSCGVILFVLLAGYLPFEDENIVSLYNKISGAQFACPSWFSAEANRIIVRILDPNPATRITTSQVLQDQWFKKGYKPPVFDERYHSSFHDVDAAFGDSEEKYVKEAMEEQPTLMNAFELISLNKGLNLDNFFESDKKFKRETRFTSQCAPKEIINRIEEAANLLGFNIEKKNYRMRMENIKAGRKGHLSIATEVFQVAPSLHVVELKKKKGDTLEFQKFYQTLSTQLKDVVCDCENAAADMS